jgi:hypothetical protein
VSAPQTGSPTATSRSTAVDHESLCKSAKRQLERGMGKLQGLLAIADPGDASLMRAIARHLGSAWADLDALQNELAAVRADEERSRTAGVQ